MKTIALIFVALGLSGCAVTSFKQKVTTTYPDRVTVEDTSAFRASVGNDQSIASVQAGGPHGLRVGRITSNQTESLGVAAGALGDAILK